MKVKFFAGKWDSWGFEISYCKYYRGLTIGLIHWYFGFEIWTKQEIADMDKNRKELQEMMAAWAKEDSKPVKKKAAAKKKTNK
jgi:hypothetical protein